MSEERIIVIVDATAAVAVAVAVAAAVTVVTNVAVVGFVDVVDDCYSVVIVVFVRVFLTNRLRLLVVSVIDSLHLK
jgi:hypothetical protein